MRQRAFSSAWKPAFRPEPWKLGAIAAVLVLASAAVHMLPLPTRVLAVPVFNLLVLTVPFGPGGVVAGFIVLFAFSGIDWLLQEHPHYRRSRLWLHAGTPILAAWTLEVALLRTPRTELWWVVLGLGALMLVGLLVTEYRSLEPAGPEFWSVQFGLGGLGMLTFFLMALYIRASQWRLLWALPALMTVGGFLALRMFYLLAMERFLFLETAVVTALLGHAVALAYRLFPSALLFALAASAWLYALFILVRNLWEGATWQEALREPALVAMLVGGLLIWLQWG